MKPLAIKAGYLASLIFWVIGLSWLGDNVPVRAVIYGIAGAATFPPLWIRLIAKTSENRSSIGPLSPSNPAHTAVGWGVAVVLGVAALPFLFSITAIGVAFAIAALIALPPVWDHLRTKGLSVSVAPRAAGVAIMVALGVLAWPWHVSPFGVVPDNLAATATDEPEAPIEKTDDGDQQVAEIRGKVADDAVIAMTADQYPDFYRQLGAARFNEANELSRWAALTTAQSDDCPTVTGVGLSDKATREALRWFVDCSNGERFNIREDQVAAFRAENDPEADEGVRTLAKAAPAVAPVSSRWKGFNDVYAISACDRLVQSTMQNPRSFETDRRWEDRRDPETGQVQFERGFRADAYIGTINSRYRCDVNADSGRITGLSIREATGWKKVL